MWVKNITWEQTSLSLQSHMTLGKLVCCSVSSSVSEGLSWHLIVHMAFRIGLAHGEHLIHGSYYYFHCNLDSREKDFKTADIRSTRPSVNIHS